MFSLLDIIDYKNPRGDTYTRRCPKDENGGSDKVLSDR